MSHFLDRLTYFSSPKELFANVRFVFVENVQQVFREALREKVQPAASGATRPAKVPQAASPPRV